MALLLLALCATPAGGTQDNGLAYSRAPFAQQSQNARVGSRRGRESGLAEEQERERQAGAKARRYAQRAAQGDYPC